MLVLYVTSHDVSMCKVHANPHANYNIVPNFNQLWWAYIKKNTKSIVGLGCHQKRKAHTSLCLL